MMTIDIQNCSQCGKGQFAPGLVCRHCGFDKLETVEIEGEGILYTYTTIHVPPDGWQESVPYCVGVITFNNGLKATARYVGKVEEIPSLGTNVKIWFKGEDFFFQ